MFYFFFADNMAQKQAVFNESDEWLSLCRESAYEISMVSNYIIKNNEFNSENIWRIFFKDRKAYIGEVEFGDEIVNIKEKSIYETSLLNYPWFSEDMIIDIIAVREYDFETSSYSNLKYSVTFKKYFNDALTSWVFWGDSSLFPICPSDTSIDDGKFILSEEYALYYDTESI